MKENNISYKWKKLLAAFARSRGRHNLKPFEAQELIDDIEMLREPVDWDQLREKFFDECTYVDTSDFSTTINDTREHNLPPEDLFEWFKKEIG